MAWRTTKWHAATCGAALIALAATGRQDRSGFTDLSDHTRTILEGNWQSCRLPDGGYGERIYDGSTPGLGRFELHLGPHHEFSLFRGVQADHRDHGATGNLLRPHLVEVAANHAHQVWQTAGLRLEVSLAGGSDEDCESWWVDLRRIDSTSH